MVCTDNVLSMVRAASRQNGEQQYGQGSNGPSAGMHPQQQQQGQPNPLQPPPFHHAQNRVATGGIPTIVEPEASTTHPGSPIEFGARTPLSQIKGFPMMGATSPAAMAQVYNTGMGMGMPGSGNRPSSAGGDLLGLGLFAQQPDALGFQGDGFSGAESFALPAVGHSRSTSDRRQADKADVGQHVRDQARRHRARFGWAIVNSDWPQRRFWRRRSDSVDRHSGFGEIVATSKGANASDRVSP